MKPILALAICCILQYTIYAQTIANGNFNSGTASWGCNPEVHAESVYGGPSSNPVAEVDAQAGLCQTITGFTVGSYYRLSFLCSRRTSCGPAYQSMHVTMSGGVVAQTFSRNATAFSLTYEFVEFFATSTSHTLTFSGTTPETCNLLVDNIQITLVSALPAELSAFTTVCSDGGVLAKWTTESEVRTDYFSIESSADGIAWNKIAQVKAQLNSQSRTDYSYMIDKPQNGTNYYRLRLTDMDGTEEILSISSLNCGHEQVAIYPNPTRENLILNAPFGEFAGIFDSSGRQISEVVSVLNKHQFQIDLSLCAPGFYYLRLGEKTYKVQRQ